MNEKVKEFLDAKKDAEKKKYEEKKKKILLELGLFEKVYSENEEYSNDFPYSEYDSEISKNRWYKKEVIAISDEEYEEVKKYSEIQDSDNNKNSIATILRATAIIVYVVGFIAGIFIGDAVAEYSWEFSWGTAFIYWFVSFFSGTTILGFAEIIQLLHDIKNK